MYGGTDTESPIGFKPHSERKKTVWTVIVIIIMIVMYKNDPWAMLFDAKTDYIF